MHDEARYHALLAGLPYPDAVSFPERVMLAQPVGKLVAAAEDAVACRSHSLECLTRHLQRAEIATHRGFDVDAAAARLRAHVPAALAAAAGCSSSPGGQAPGGADSTGGDGGLRGGPWWRRSRSGVRSCARAQPSGRRPRHAGPAPADRRGGALSSPPQDPATSSPPPASPAESPRHIVPQRVILTKAKEGTHDADSHHGEP